MIIYLQWLLSWPFVCNDRELFIFAMIIIITLFFHNDQENLHGCNDHCHDFLSAMIIVIITYLQRWRDLYAYLVVDLSIHVVVAAMHVELKKKTCHVRLI